MTAGEAMRAARERAGLQQKELAALSGLPAHTISVLEAGRRQGMLCTIETLADALGISIDEYVGHEVLGPRRGPEADVEKLTGALRQSIDEYAEAEEQCRRKMAAMQTLADALGQSVDRLTGRKGRRHG